MSEWASNSNEALTLSLGLCRRMLQESTTASHCFRTVRASEDRALLGEEEDYEKFYPTFTYPVSESL